MSQPKLYGFDGSTYVRTVRCLLEEKDAGYDQVPVNVLEGEPREAEHLERHPFGKVPVLDHDGIRIRETSAICRYLNDVLPGKSLIPDNPKDRARMDEAISLTDSYGYGSLIGAVAAYHLFPDLVGGVSEEQRKDGIEASKLVLKTIMELRGSDDWIAGSEPTLADFHLGPICFYVSLTPDKDEVFSVPGFADWWERLDGLESFKKTEPDLG